MATKKTSTASPVPLAMASAFERGMCLYVRMSCPGFMAKVDPSEITQEGINTEPLRVSKALLKCQEYNEIKQIHGRIKKFLRTASLPIPHFFNSFYFIPDPKIEEVFAFLDAIVTEHDKIRVPAFIKAYKQAKEEAKVRLGPKLYDEDDYPEASHLRNAFAIVPEVIEQAVPHRLAQIDPARYRIEQQRLQEKHAKTAMEMRTYLRQSIYEMLSHLKEKLTGSREDGRAKMIRSTAMTHIEEFLAFFENGGDVTNDTELQGAIQKVKATMKGLDLEQAKHDDQYRAMMAKTIGGITKEMDKFIVSAPRKIKLGGGKGTAAA